MGLARPPQALRVIAFLIGLRVAFAAQSALAGSIVSWGGEGEARAEPPTADDFIAVATGERHSVALRSDGSIVAGGFGIQDLGRWPSYGQAIAPDGNDFVAIVAGAYHSLALRSGGSIAAWGLDYAAPPDGNDFVAIAAGDTFIGFLDPASTGAEPLLSLHALALKSDGSVVGWAGGLGEANTYGIMDSMNGYDVIPGSAGDIIKKKSQIRNPGQRLVFLDEGKTSTESWTVYRDREEWWDNPTVRHGLGTNWGMADGHIEYWKWQDMRTVKIARGEAGSDALKSAKGNPDLYRIQRGVWGKRGYTP